MLRPTVVNLLILSFIGKMMIFDLVWIMTGGGPLWSTETVSTYVYKRAFDWNTFDLGYPSAIAVLWFVHHPGLRRCCHRPAAAPARAGWSSDACRRRLWLAMSGARRCSCS